MGPIDNYYELKMKNILLITILIAISNPLLACKGSENYWQHKNYTREFK